MLKRAFRTTVWAGAAFTLFLAGNAHAQDPRVEIGADAGWTFSDGVTFAGVLAGNGNLYDGIEPKDSFSYGLHFGFLVSSSAEVGFLFSQQKSTLQVTGTSPFEIGDQSVNNYHGYFAYNFGDSGSKVRPYLLVGAGVTSYGGVDYTVGPVTGTTDGNSKFSPTFGAGLKLFPSQRFGVKLGARWTPTYIKSDSVGWWCDPYWGCYVVSDPQYSNQFEVTGGLMIRF